MQFSKKEWRGLTQCLLALDKLELNPQDRQTFNDVYRFVYNDRLSQKGLQLLDQLCDYYRVPLFERSEDKRDKTAGSRWCVPQEKRLEFIRDQLRQDKATTATKGDLIEYHEALCAKLLETGVFTAEQIAVMRELKPLQLKKKTHPVEQELDSTPESEEIEASQAIEPTAIPAPAESEADLRVLENAAWAARDEFASHFEEVVKQMQPRSREEYKRDASRVIPLKLKRRAFHEALQALIQDSDETNQIIDSTMDQVLDSIASDTKTRDAA
ncbi:MAG TPA: hypothetical protein VM639_00815 [Dongiaceae bacterium]|nr:hypothetical protein [Dongiaceae bacterium]